MKYHLISLLLMLGLCGNAQYQITGVVIDESTSQPIDYATVMLSNKSTDVIITGTTTENGGKFQISSDTKDVAIELSFIGYTNRILDDLSFDGNSINLGKIVLSADAKTLDEVIVRADKSTTEFKLDKRVFNVGTDLSTTGASALEILNNVPSVNVSIEGEVSLRGASGVQMLINGKPSILADDQSNALGTITADMIEKVEVITNPSAKYEAEGTAGIINIVLKKNEKNGLNGSVTVNAGVPDNHSLGLSLNRRTSNFNLFTQLGVGYRNFPRDNENVNIDLLTDTKLTTLGSTSKIENFYNFIIGSDLYLNPLNVITLSASLAYEIEDETSETDFTLVEKGTTKRGWTRQEVTEATNPKYQYELLYKKDFEDDKDHQLNVSAIGNFFGKDQSSAFDNTFTTGANNQPDQITATDFREGKYTFNIDYTKPYNKEWTLETGAQYLVNGVSNEYSVSNEESDGSFTIDESLTNTFEYNQNVLAGYATGAYEDDLWGVKLGLRVENTDLSTLLINTNEANDLNFTNLFPSAHTSLKLAEGISVQAGYSKRIFRPRLWDLNPFFNIRNNFSIRVGNPNLLPEYTDSYEAGAIFIFGQTSLNVNVYHRYTTDQIERVSTFENNVNTFRPENIGTNKATGIEANFKHSPTRAITLNGDFNYNIYVREGQFSDINFDFTADQWSGKLTSKFKLNKNVDMELTGRYRSREETVQGVISDNLFADFGFRYKILKGQGVFNVSVRDVFASSIRETTIDNRDFYIYSKGQRGRFVTVGFSYGFGKGEAMHFSGKKHI